VIPKSKTIFATLEPIHLIHFRLLVSWKKLQNARYRTDDVTVKLALSCVVHHCTNYPRLRRVLLAGPKHC